MLVSMNTTGRSKANASIAPAVAGPTPGSRCSASRSAGMLPLVLVHDRLHGSLQGQCAPVVTESAPLFQHRAEGGPRQRRRDPGSGPESAGSSVTTRATWVCCSITSETRMA